MRACLRWGSGRNLALASFSISFAVIFVLTWNNGLTPKVGGPRVGPVPAPDSEPFEWGPRPESSRGNADQTLTCLPSATANIETGPILSGFDFQPYWMKSREYWDNNFENRYKARRKDWPNLPLKVILVPHSHNDPGWLRTYENYYHYQTRNVLNSMAEKLTKFRNMTFIWSEMIFLAQWWQTAHPTKRRLVRKLLNEKRLEITTGGWVMTDEATSHVFAMVDQLIHGHQWIRNKLGIKPRSGWSIDPFGHGPTVPYLLKEAGLDGGAVIQRIHYAWKQWLAKENAGDFIWRQNWDPEGYGDMLVHNMPFDIYSIKHTCGPHPQVCLSFDFRKITGEYTEYSLKAVAIDENNVKQKAELLLEQYGRTGSLFPHNVVLMPLGDDFRYDHDIEWDQQYRNYKRLFDFINSHEEYNAHVKFGTPAEYFDEIRRRMSSFKTLKGDFFVYSDIFSEGRPAYWSGYFTTRPYWKVLDRELSANLRSAEILYSLALSRLRRLGFNSTLRVLERDFEKLTSAREALALFQHHDAITGTSKAFVMHDYALKLFEAITASTAVQSFSLQTILTKPESFDSLPLSTRFIVPDTERETYEDLPTKAPILVTQDRPKRLLVFNSLAQHRTELIRVRVRSENVRVLDSDFVVIPSQLSPVWNMTEPEKLYEEATPPLTMFGALFELSFIVELPPLTITTFIVEAAAPAKKAAVYCDCTPTDVFPTRKLPQGDVQLENDNLRLLIDGRTGFLKSVMDKPTGKVTQCGLQFASYPSAQFHSGAYLFMPDPNSRESEKDFPDETSPPRRIIVQNGPIHSSLTVLYGDTLSHKIEIYHSTELSKAIYIENILYFGPPPKNHETELFMRFKSDVSNGEPPELYTDQNGLGTQKRVKVERIGIEGNYYPVTTHLYIQDTEKRLTLLVNHACGGASWQPGWLEVMLDRRTLYDDSRGMGEGVIDNKRTTTKFWLILEPLNGSPEDYSSLSLLGNRLSLGLLYPPNTFVLESTLDEATSLTTERTLYKRVNLVSKEFPCDVHLMNLRTMQDPRLDHFPSSSALMVLQRFGHSCAVQPIPTKCSFSTGTALHPSTHFVDTTLALSQVTLTGLTTLRHLDHLHDLELRPMNLATVNVTFL